MSFIFCGLLFLKTKKLEQALFLGFLATLPFTKGKVYETILLPYDQVKTATNALFNIDFAFHFYIADVFLVVLAWILVRNKNFIKKLKTFSFEKHELLLIGFIFFSMLSGYLSQFPIISILSTLQIVRLFLIMVLPKLLTKKPKIKHIWEIIASIIIFQFLLILLQRMNSGTLGIYIESYLYKEELGIRGNELSSLLRFSGTFFEPSIFGTFLLMVYAFMENFYRKAKRTEKMISKIIMIIIAFCILLTGSRGVYLIFFSYLIFQFRNILKPKKLKKIINLSNIKHIFLILVPMTFVIPYLSVRFSDFYKLFSELGSGTYRLQMFIESYYLATRNLLGVGLNLSPYNFAIQRFSERIIFDPAHPHNIFFQILAETGFIGLLIFGLFIYYAIKETPNFYKNPFFFSIVYFILAAQLYPIFINQPEIISHLFLYIGLSRIYKKI